MVFKQGIKMSLLESRTGTDMTGSKNQYTRKLKDWRIAKNSKSSIWKYADRKLRSRAREGKKSNVLLHGTLQPQSKVRKEIARHVTFTSTFENMEGASTPEGITIFTPPADNFALSHREVYIGNLPSVQLKEKVQTFSMYLLFLIIEQGQGFGVDIRVISDYR